MDELIRRARRGDQEAFVILMERNKQSLWRVAMAVLHDPDDAADAMQDTVLEAWKNLPKLVKTEYFTTWLTRILLYNSYDILRKRRREAPAQTLREEGAEQRPDDTLDVQRTMAQLAENDRLILTLFYMNDLPVRAIARVLAISEGAVRVRLTRARERFKRAYENGEDRKERRA